MALVVCNYNSFWLKISSTCEPLLAQAACASPEDGSQSCRCTLCLLFLVMARSSRESCKRCLMEVSIWLLTKEGIQIQLAQLQVTVYEKPKKRGIKYSWTGPLMFQASLFGSSTRTHTERHVCPLQEQWQITMLSQNQNWFIQMFGSS